MTTPAPAAAGLPVAAPAAAGLVLSHYIQAQQAITARAALAVHNLWTRLIDPANFSDSWKTLGPLINGLIAEHYSMTSAQAVQYYTNARVLAGAGHIAVPRQTADMGYVGRVTDAMGPGQFFHYLKENEPPAASAMARDGMSGASTRMIMMGGRDTVTGATAVDPFAEGWERVIQPGSCGFCAMLAGRGAVYKESTVDFRAHDSCHCVARAVFKGQESVNSGLSDEWAKATKGTRGAAARTAWNKYWESKNVEPKAGPAQKTTEVGPGHGAIGRERIGRPALPDKGPERRTQYIGGSY
jgi:hypothetical protein